MTDKETLRNELLQQFSGQADYWVDYWAGVPDLSTEERLHGLIYSILNSGACNIPDNDLVPTKDAKWWYVLPLT